MGPSEIRETKMTCSKCETDENRLRRKGLEPFSFENEGRAGRMQASDDVAECRLEGQEEEQVGTKPVELSKREATFLVHVSEHFPHGFVAGDVASSLGWPMSELLGVLDACVALGLVGEAAGAANADYARTTLQLPQCLDDILDAEEQDAARRSKLPFDDLFISSGEALAVMRAITDEDRTCFTEEELEAALRWASQLKWAATILDLVALGWVGIERSSLSTGDPRFIALDQDGALLVPPASNP